MNFEIKRLKPPGLYMAKYLIKEQNLNKSKIEQMSLLEFYSYRQSLSGKFLMKIYQDAVKNFNEEVKIIEANNKK